MGESKMEIIKRILQILVRTKVYMARSMSYISMINSAMILFLLLSSLERYGIDINIKEYIIPIVIISILFLIAWGWIEDRLGLWQYEQAVSQDRSKFNQKMLEKMEKMEAKLDAINTQMSKLR